jgi:broad specificity phosphatase PhoE
MKTIYLVRHGESAENVGHTLQGDASPLTELGRSQALAVAARCARLSADAIVSSTMLRARETAHAVAEATGISMETSELFVERRFPTSVVGKESNDSEVRALMDQWSASMYAEGDRVEDGESFELIKQRAIDALSYLEEHPAKSIILVSHGFFMRAMMAVIIFGNDLTGAELKKLSYALRTKNTGISVLTHSETVERAWEDSPGWKIRVFNDHAHLG